MNVSPDESAPSSAVPLSEVREVLAGSLVGGAGQLRARLSGITGEQRRVAVIVNPRAEQDLVADFDDILPSDQPGVPEDLEQNLLIGLHSAGTVGQSAVVVQVLRHADHTEISAHTLNGHGARQALSAALTRVEEILTAASTD